MEKKGKRRKCRIQIAKAAAAFTVGVLICLLSAWPQNLYLRYGSGYQAVFWKMNEMEEDRHMQKVERKRRMQTEEYLSDRGFQLSYYGMSSGLGALMSSGAAVNGASAAMNSAMGAGASAAGTSQEAEFSSTNVRTKGVEEGDTVKTDGKYIYTYQQIDGKTSCYIYEAAHENTEKIASFSLETKDGYNVEDMYLKDGKLIFVADQFISTHAEKRIRNLYRKAGGDFDKFCRESWENEDYGGGYYSLSDDNTEEDDTGYWYADACYTRTWIYDVSDPYHPALEKELFQDGAYEGSRMVDHDLYVISSRKMNPGAVRYQQEETYIPQIGGKCVPDDKVDLSEKGNTTYQLLSSVDIISGKYIDKRAVLGGNSQIYVSQNAIYLMDETYLDCEYIFAKLLDKLSWQEDRSGVVLADWFLNRFGYSCATLANTGFRALHSDDKIGIIKYSYQNGTLKKEAEGEIRGHLNSDYSVDEQDGYLRIVTTYYSDITYQEKNAVYILDQHLKVSGKLMGIAPEESVYAVRFLGDLAYFVTYEETDPVFTVDLSDPASPEIIGELKLPGFSSYMHPLGDHLMLGIGRTDANKLKLSLFDTTDPMHVKEIHKKVLPYSEDQECEALDNPNAFFIDEKRQMVGFSMSYPYWKNAEYDIANGSYWQTVSRYLVYCIDEKKGFTEVCYAEQKYSSGENIRGLSIDGYFYIVNPEMAMKKPGNAIGAYTFPEFEKCG